jgi:antirestriction protein ArdC
MTVARSTPKTTGAFRLEKGRRKERNCTPSKQRHSFGREQNIHANDLRKQITAQIIEDLESDNLPPWRKPWIDDPAAGFPTNALTHRHYTGINPLLLDLNGMRQGFQSRFWAKFRQWKELGGGVKLLRRRSHFKQLPVVDLSG